MINDAADLRKPSFAGPVACANAAYTAVHNIETHIIDRMSTTSGLCHSSHLAAPAHPSALNADVTVVVVAADDILSTQYADIEQ